MSIQVYKLVRGPRSGVDSRPSTLDLRPSTSARLAVAALVVLSMTKVTPAQDVPRLTESSEVSVITILPGEPLYSSFGHTAIRIHDDAASVDVGYNFGTFDFDEDGFYIKFLRGKLDYVLARNRFDDVLYGYQMEERPVMEQRLNFSLAERQALFDRLEVNHLPENRAYRYEFLYDNCSTRPRDVIEAVWGYEMAGTETSDVATFRNLIDRYLADKPWTRFGIDLLLGAPTDVVASPRQRMFLPDEFLAGVRAAGTPGGVRLSEPTDTLYWSPGYSRWSGAKPWPAIVGWILLVAVAALSFYVGERQPLGLYLRRFDGAIFVIVGCIGCLIALLWFATEHTVTKSNWNLLWALPTHIWLGLTFLHDRWSPFLAPYLWISLGAVGATVVGWFWIPQELTPWLVPYLGIVLIRTAANVRNTLG